MRILFFVLTGLILMSSCKPKADQIKLTYPETARVDTVDIYFGDSVADPFRWLEDDNSAETAEWVKAQNAVTSEYLSRIPFIDQLKKRFTDLWNYPRYSAPFRKGDYYFFFKNDGIQNQSVLYVKDSTGAERVFLDPNKLSSEGTVALGSLGMSKDARYFAYSTASAGSDWNEIRVMETATGNLLPDHIQWVKFSGISWHGDGFYYSRYDKPADGRGLSAKNEFHKVYYHKLGTEQSQDVLVYENRSYPLRNYVVFTTEDENYAFLSETESTSGNSLSIKDLGKGGKTFTRIAEGFNFEYNVVDNVENRIFMITNDGAPKYRLVEFDANDPAKENWKTVIPETENVLTGVQLAGGRLLATYMQDANSKAFVYDLDGKQLHEVVLPALGTIDGFSGRKQDNEAYFMFTSFTFPSTVYKYDIAANRSEVLYESRINFDPSKYETRQVFYNSKDGTKVPMFLVYKKGLKMDGKNPVYLYSYGGFNISLTPSFSVGRLPFLESGGIYAMPNIRGGGEYGEQWHKAGTKLQKQNVFDDFIAAAEYLVAEKYTEPSRIAIAGGSNGGLLVGAAMTQRPDLFGVALPAVGVLDMLRFHKFTIGWAWTGDYGSSEDSVQYKYLRTYSPLHNLKKGTCYPATLITTADHDDRVVPAHSFKFAATLQEAQGCAKPALIRIDTDAGHGAGKPVSKVIEEAAEVWGFTMYNLGMTPKE